MSSALILDLGVLGQQPFRDLPSRWDSLGLRLLNA